MTGRNSGNTERNPWEATSLTSYHPELLPAGFPEEKSRNPSTYFTVVEELLALSGEVGVLYHHGNSHQMALTVRKHDEMDL